MSTVKANRISDLETILLWEGEIDNPRVREILGVQPVWASRLLAELAVRMADRAERMTSHSPLKMRLNANIQAFNSTPDEYLRVISGAAQSQTNVEDARQDQSVVSPHVFALVSRAIRLRVGLSITYRSMTSPQGKVRIIFPHIMVRAARRWHVRAWCIERNAFRDFTLGRMRNVALVNDVAPHERDVDQDWNTMVTIQIAAHPALNLQQQDMIADEYFPGAKSKTLTMRRCLVGYTILDLSLATDVDVQRPPEYQLFVIESAKILPLFQ